MQGLQQQGMDMGMQAQLAQAQMLMAQALSDPADIWRPRGSVESTASRVQPERRSLHLGREVWDPDGDRSMSQYA